MRTPHTNSVQVSQGAHRWGCQITVCLADTTGHRANDEAVSHKQTINLVTTISHNKSDHFGSTQHVEGTHKQKFEISCFFLHKWYYQLKFQQSASIIFIRDSTIIFNTTLMWIRTNHDVMHCYFVCLLHQSDVASDMQPSNINEEEYALSSNGQL